MFGRPKSEIELLRASLQGSTQAFEVLVGKYQSLVCAITYSSTGSVEKSEELAQESFLRAWKSLDQLQDLAKFRAWLCSIARSTVQNWLRDRRQDVLGKAAPLDCAVEKSTEEAGPEEIAMRNEQRALIAHALAGMPESLREPLVLFYREHKSTREVARQLGLSEAAARQRVSRARGVLRDQMAAMVETTIARTKPGRAFTTAVIAAVAASAVKTTTTAAAATGLAAVATSSSGGAAVLSGLTAKVVALAAGVAIVAGGAVAYKHLAKPDKSSAVASSERQSQTQIENVAAAQSVVSAANQESTTDNESPAPSAVDPALAARPVEHDRVRAAAMPQTQPYEFTPKGVLSGTITDIDTGEPVRDAVVYIGERWMAESRTDANGFYSFDRVREAGSYPIWISSTEYVGISRRETSTAVYLSNDKQTIKHLQLPKACLVDVWVTDSNGAPLPKSNVILTSLADDRSGEIGSSSRRHQTDPNGYILLGGIPPARTNYLITVWHTAERQSPESRAEYDFAPVGSVIQLTDPNVVKQAQIALQKGQQVEGYAEYTDGIPANDIEISPAPAWWHCNYSVIDTPLNADGTFTLKHIMPGMYNIGMYVPRPDNTGGVLTVISQAQLPPDDGQPLLVRIPGKSSLSLASISGRVVFTGGKKPDSVHVEASSESGGSAFTDIWSRLDDESSDTFVLDRLEPGTYTVRFSGGGIEEKTLRDVAAPSAGLVVELVCAGKPLLTGTIVDRQTGLPIKVFRVRVRKLQTLRGPNYVQSGRWVQLENGEGHFSVEAVGPGLYQVQAVADGYAPRWSEEISTDLLPPATIALSPGGTVAGTVVNSSGEPIDAVKVIPLSLAGGTMPRTNDTFVSEDGAVETTAGAFTLKNLPPGVETLKVTHPDYTSAMIGDVRVVEGTTTGGLSVTLTAGGTVEGCVYDDQGAPQAAQVLYVQDDEAYGGSGDELAGRLGTAITDSNGFYRVAHLPEALCYVHRADEWEHLGVVRRTVVPQDDRMICLDFGGTPLVSGAAVVDGAPLAGIRLMLGSVDSPHFGAFRCFAKTDEHGAFVFPGIARGTHAIYYERPDKRNEWLKIATVTVADVDMNLGVVPRDASGLTVTIDTSQAGPAWQIRDVFITDSDRQTAAPFRTAEAPTSPGGPWRIDDVGPGAYMLTATRADGVRWQTRIDLKAGQGPWQIALTPPRGDAKVSGRVLGEANWLALWREAKGVWRTITARNGEEFSIAGLPAGKYFIGNDPAFLFDLPALMEFTLGEGENKTIDVQPNTKLPEMGFLLALIVDEKGLPRNDVHVSLEGLHGTVEPLECKLTGYCFTTTPGKYTLRVEAAGYKPSRTELTLRPYGQPSGSTDGKTQKITVHLQP